MNSKVLAMYLPQFYRTKENDEWWGEGFTDWTTVRGAKPLFDGHIQPEIPLNDNYYDLMDKETMRSQFNLMQKYGVDGICIYHYWFKEGRQILEKPAENLLTWKDLNIQYCFCWANETWTRTWSNFGDSNVWAAKYEKNGNYDDSGILLEQQYGNGKEWERHFNYLLPFFRDERYIKYEDKPVFVIYRPNLIFCLEEMMELWDLSAKENGFAGVYFIFANCTQREEKLADLILIHEPQYTFNHSNIKKIDSDKIYGIYDYAVVADKSLKFVSKEPNVAYGGFVGYDDTPRRGKKGVAIINRTSDQFKEYMRCLLAKNEAAGSPYVFINAWNEWGEGMHLEPDKYYKEDCLQAIQDAKGNYSTEVENYRELLKTPTIRNESDQKNKYMIYTEILHNWLLKKERGKKFADYLKTFNIRSVAVYGLGILGKHFISELKDSDLLIKYAIDEAEDVRANAKIPVYKKEQIMKLDVDAIVVTVIYDYESIKNELKKYTGTKIMSLEQIVMEC